ncbi:MAG: hypothetical protein V4550_21475 [Gemmatimonadota bacterium]
MKPTLRPARFVALSAAKGPHLLFLSLLFASGCQSAPPRLMEQPRTGFGPGARVLLDAHNAYPERGKFSDRIDLALATGLPVAIEQDLYWVRQPSTGQYAAIVAHGTDETTGAPTMESYFFDKIAPIMERALAEQRTESWPLIVLNLDFKTNERALHEAVLALLDRHPDWLTTAPRTNTPDIAAPLTVGPLMVLSGQDSSQRTDFHDRIPVGGRLAVFGAIPVPAATGANRDERAVNAVRASAATLIAPRVSNYARWVNFPWQVVEVGGQVNAGEWTTEDSARLSALVARAHEQGLWIRFYTLDGYDPSRDEGLTTSYNFGSERAVSLRWRAAIAAGVDFIATDHYTRFHRERRP